jgi:hypothetical protein
METLPQDLYPTEYEICGTPDGTDLSGNNIFSWHDARAMSIVCKEDT